MKLFDFIKDTKMTPIFIACVALAIGIAAQFLPGEGPVESAIEQVSEKVIEDSVGVDISFDKTA